MVQNASAESFREFAEAFSGRLRLAMGFVLFFVACGQPKLASCGGLCKDIVDKADKPFYNRYKCVYTEKSRRFLILPSPRLSLSLSLSLDRSQDKQAGIEFRDARAAPGGTRARARARAREASRERLGQEHSQRLRLQLGHSSHTKQLGDGEIKLAAFPLSSGWRLGRLAD